MWILYGALGIIALLLAVAVIRTLLIKAPKVTPRPMDFPREQLDTYGEKMRDMIRVETVSRREDEDLSQFYLFHRELERLFPKVH